MFTLMELVQPQSLEEAYEILMKRKNNIVIGEVLFLEWVKKNRHWYRFIKFKFKPYRRNFRLY